MLELQPQSPFNKEILAVIKDKDLTKPEYDALKVKYREFAKKDGISDENKIEQMFNQALESYISKSSIEKLKTGGSDAVIHLDLIEIEDSFIVIDKENTPEKGKIDKKLAESDIKGSITPIDPIDKDYVSVNFNNNSTEFQELVKMAREAKLTPEGKIEYSELDKLEEYAKKSGGILTKDEQLLIKALRDEKNISVLKGEGFNSEKFSMRIFHTFLDDTHKKAWDEERDDFEGKLVVDNPLDSKIQDVGADKYYNTLYALRNAKPEEISQKENEIKTKINSFLETRPELKASVDKLLSSLDKMRSTNDESSHQLDNLEALLYINEMLDRKPPLQEGQMKQITDKLNEMLGKDYDYRIGKSKELVLSALHDVSTPSNISQRAIGTCGAACIQIQMAIREPAEYLNMLDTLASNKNYVTASGKVIKPNMTFHNDSTQRSPSSKIIQNSLMEFAKEYKITFDSEKKLGDKGLLPTEQNMAYNAIFKSNNKAYNIGEYTSDQLLSILSNAKPSITDPVTISMVFAKSGSDSFHFVNVIGVEGNNIKIINPWGREETLTIDKLKPRIFAVSAPPGKDQGIQKTTDVQIKQMLDNDSWYNSTDWIAGEINKKGNELLDKLTLSQKVKIIKSLMDGTTTEKDENAIKKILNHLTSGTDGQNKQAIFSLSEEMKKQGVTLSRIMDELHEDSKEFYTLANKLYKGSISEDFKDWDLAKYIMTGTKTNIEFLRSLSEVDLGFLAVGASDKGDKLADNPDVAAKTLRGLYKVYLGNSSSPLGSGFLNALKKFQKGINDDYDTGDVVKKLDELEPQLSKRIAEKTGIAFEND